MNQDYIIYPAIGISVIFINYLVMRFFVKTKKQAIIFMIVRMSIVVGVAVYALTQLKPNSREFALISGFILAMLVHNPPKEKKKPV